MTAHDPATAPAAARHAFRVCAVGYALNAMDALLLTPAMNALTSGPAVQKSGLLPIADADVVLLGMATLLSSALGG